MTKVATIDTRRFLALLLIAAMLMVMIPIAVAVLPSSVLATDNVLDNEGTTGGSFTTNDNSSVPLVNSITLTENGGGGASNMDPETEYHIEVSVTDNQTLEHLAQLQVTLFYDLGADNGTAPVVANTQTCAIMTWDNTSTWTLTNMGGGSSWTFHDGDEPELTNNTGTFEFHFEPGIVATESAGALNWDIYAYALDEGASEGDLYLRDKNMNWYGEINTVSPTVDFGLVALGAQDMSSDLTATYISNGDYSEQAQTESTWTNGGYSISLKTDAGLPGDGEFTLYVNDESDSGPETRLTDSYGDIDDNETITDEDGVTNGAIHLWLTLGQASIPSGTYSGDINFAISNR